MVPTVTEGSVSSVVPNATGTGIPPAETTSAAGQVGMRASALAAVFAVFLVYNSYIR